MEVLSVILIFTGACCFIWRCWFTSFKKLNSHMVNAMLRKVWFYEYVPLVVWVTIFVFDLDEIKDDVWDLLWIDMVATGWIVYAVVFYMALRVNVKRFQR